MAVSSKYTHLWINEYEFSGDTTSAQVATTAETIDTTAFQDEGRTSIGAIPEMTITHSGHLTIHDTDSVEAELQTYIESGTAFIALGLGTNVEGYPCKVLPDAVVDSYEINEPVDGLLTIDGAGWRSSTGHQAGFNVFYGTLSATGTQSSVDFTTAGTAGGKAYVIVKTITGSATDATIDIESSSDDASFASEGTATFSAVGVQTVTMTGTVNRYIRINCTSLGTATSFAVAVIVCVNDVTIPS